MKKRRLGRKQGNIRRSKNAKRITKQEIRKKSNRKRGKDLQRRE